jgi:hypothetical protein
MCVLTVRAGAATVEAHDDPIADSHMPDAASDGLDDPGTFVTKHNRHRDRQHAIAHSDVCVADSAGDDSDEQLIVSRNIQLDVVDTEGKIAALADRRYGNSHHASLCC